MAELSSLQEGSLPLSHSWPHWPSFSQGGLALSEVTNAYRCSGEALVMPRHVLKAQLQAEDLYLPLCYSTDLLLEPVRPSGK